MISFTAQSEPDFVHQSIASVYSDLGIGKGWSYIYSLLETRQQPKLVTIGLNPGGGKGDDDWHENALLAYTAKDSIANTYFDQPWLANGGFTALQTQIQKLRCLHFPDVGLDRMLSFQFIPFRSPSWATFPSVKRQAAVAFGKSLLDWTLGQITQETVVVGFGLNAIRQELVDWFDASERASVPVGWGRIHAAQYETPRCKRLILLPHLSRYQIIGRPQFTEAARLFA